MSILKHFLVVDIIMLISGMLVHPIFHEREGEFQHQDACTRHSCGFSDPIKGTLRGLLLFTKFPSLHKNALPQCSVSIDYLYWERMIGDSDSEWWVACNFGITLACSLCDPRHFNRARVLNAPFLSSFSSQNCPAPFYAPPLY